MAIDLFDTRTMLEAVEQLRTPTKFLLNTFFPSEVTFETKYVDIDIYKGKRRVSAYVERQAEGQNVEKIGYKTETYEPPYLKPKKAITVDDLLKRTYGNNIYGAQSGEQRAATQLGRELADLDAMISRAEEVQASQALFDGIVVANDINGNPVATIDYGRSGTHSVDIGGANYWDQVGADPLTDIRAGKRQVMQSTDLMVDVCVMGHDALDAFLNNDEVRAYLDNRRFPQNAQLQMEGREMGATYVGNIEGIDFWGYDSWYLDASQVEQPLVPANKILLASSMAKTNRLYGVIEDISQDTLFAVPRYPKSWTEEDPAVRYLQMHSAPLIVTHEVDGFYVAQVLA